MPRGGPRPNSGRPPGARNKATVQANIDKDLHREELRRLVCAALVPMTQAQIANAMGIKYLVLRQKSTGKFTRIGADGALAHDPDTETIEVWEKDPAIQAYSDLLNRALDKPQEPKQQIEISGDADLIATLLAGRQHAAKLKTPAK